MIKSLWDKYKKRRQARKEKEKNMTPFETVVSWVKTIVGAFIVVLFINGLAIASFVVPTGSMENTVMTGDFLFVNKFVYGYRLHNIFLFWILHFLITNSPAFKTLKKAM